MHRVSLVDFRAEDVERIEPWFDDQETQVRLGGRDWIRREPSFLWLTVGGEFRGKIVTGRLSGSPWTSPENRSPSSMEKCTTGTRPGTDRTGTTRRLGCR